jgi:hypothetical protein
MELWSVGQLSLHLLLELKVQEFIGRGRFSRTFWGLGPQINCACKKALFQSLLLNDDDVRRFVLWMVRSIHP